MSRAFQSLITVVTESKIINYLFRHLVHSKIGLALESGRIMGENRTLTSLHALTRDSHALAHPTRRAYAR